MSMSEPNLQNVPIRTAMGKRIRNGFIPRDGHRWIKCDADQIEMRILTHLSQDPGLIAAFQSDKDFFVNLGIQLFHEPDFTKADPRRQLIKNGGYAKIYGAGLDKFAKTAGSSTEEASEFMNNFDTTYPGIARFVHEVEVVARQRLHDEGESYVRSPLTGRKHVADPRKEYALVNYLIQGLAGEVLKMKIVELDAAGLDEFMLFPVHDEIDEDVPIDRVDEVVQTLMDVCNDSKLLTVPITWTPAVGDRWGDAKDLW
jgi:DNA polymerase-1